MPDMRVPWLVVLLLNGGQSFIHAGAGGRRRAWRLPLTLDGEGLENVDLAEFIEDSFATALSADGYVSAKATVTTGMVSEIVGKQRARPLAAAALGRALTCSLMLADGMKQDETFQVKFQGDGPLHGVLAIANGKLEARGYTGNPRVNLPLNAKGKLDVGGGVGQGELVAVRYKQLPGAETPAPYSSITQIRSGEVAEDINHYLHESEQREGALAAGVHTRDPLDGEFDGEDVGCEVTAAGGWSVTLLPGAPDEVATALGANLEALDMSPSQMIRAGWTPEIMLRRILKGMEPNVFEPRKPTFKCTCSEKKLYRTLRLLPENELKQIYEYNDEAVSSKCEFCGTVYNLSADQIRAELEKPEEDLDEGGAVEP